jgi:hypothetical protein
LRAATFPGDDCRKGGKLGICAERVDIRQDVVKYCDQKTPCQFRVGDESFPGKAYPSPGNDKGLIAMWKRGESEHKYQCAERKIARLGCA